MRMAEGALRDLIIGWVDERAARNGGSLSWEELLTGFREPGGEVLPLIDRSRGIRNPAHFEATLSVVSSAAGPYDDAESEDGLFHYAYRAGDEWSGDNRKLRRAYELKVPILFFRKEKPKVYTPVVPAYVVDDRPDLRSFVIAFDESFTFIENLAHMSDRERAYAHRQARIRLHQPAFRTRVLQAYETRCAICRIRHAALLDGAHIIPDSEPAGTPEVTNGLALCKIHHAAYDQNLLGVTPNYRVEIAAPLLAETDGPMLRHGLQDMHGATLTLPRSARERPARDNLAWRYDHFRAVHA